MLILNGMNSIKNSCSDIRSDEFTLNMVMSRHLNFTERFNEERYVTLLVSAKLLKRSPNYIYLQSVKVQKEWIQNSWKARFQK